jgi:hypothetical protein
VIVHLYLLVRHCQRLVVNSVSDHVDPRPFVNSVNSDYVFVSIALCCAVINAHSAS